VTPLDLPAVLTVEEAASVLRIGRSAAYQAARSGDLPTIKIGRAIRVPRHRLVELLGEPKAEPALGADPGPAGETEEEVDEKPQGEPYPA
jgi:excisionase family DNA binding protein